MTERDCNNCANHVQASGIDEIPPGCWSCLNTTYTGSGSLPNWEPIEFVSKQQLHPDYVQFHGLERAEHLQMNAQPSPSYADMMGWLDRFPNPKTSTEQLDAKPTNPKDAIGSKKLPLNLVPDSLEVFAATAFLEGALKYGSCNWRVAGVRSSIYMAAAKRHMKKYWNGEDFDPKTKVAHLASAIACLGIVLDAELVGKLTDDRPPKADMSGLIDGMEETVEHLQELFKDHRPHHHTILD